MARHLIQSRPLGFVVDSPGLTTFVPGGLFGSSFNNGSFGPQTATTIDGQQTCRITTPFMAQLQLKLNGSVPLPLGFAVSGVFQDGSGTTREGVYAATTAEAALSLGRPLSGGARTINVPLLVSNTEREGRIRRLDLRLTKMFQITSRVRLQANLDAYNMLNSSAIQTLNFTDGPLFLAPTGILDPRLLQISGQPTF